MTHQIVKQPNGLYAVWSTGVDDFVLVDATVSELVDEFIDMERERTVQSVHRIVEALGKDEKPYHQFTRPFDELVAQLKRDKPKSESLTALGIE